jgi:hypothetical protein
VDTLDLTGPPVRLRYSWVWRPSGREGHEDYRVGITAKQYSRGGVRFWFVCPLVLDGVKCGRRVRKLYLPPAGRYFGATSPTSPPCSTAPGRPSDTTWLTGGWIGDGSGCTPRGDHTGALQRCRGVHAGL